MWHASLRNSGDGSNGAGGDSGGGGGGGGGKDGVGGGVEERVSELLFFVLIIPCNCVAMVTRCKQCVVEEGKGVARWEGGREGGC